MRDLHFSSTTRLCRFARLFYFSMVFAVLSLRASGSNPMPIGVSKVRLIGVQSLPRNAVFRDTTVGGLSGLDYDSNTLKYIAVSDDKSEFGPARVYELRLDLDENEFRSVMVVGVISLRQADGSTYPNRLQLAAGGVLPDLESIRWDPHGHGFWYTSEGDRPLEMQPFVRHAAPDGSLLQEVLLPTQLYIHRDLERGPRQNLSLEGLSMSPDGKSVWLGMEGPLYEDGLEPTSASGAISRITQLTTSGKVIRQFAYPIDAIPVPGARGKWSNNGISEILCVNEHEFFVLERCVSQSADDTVRFFCRLYLADSSGATDISSVKSLSNVEHVGASKRMLFDFLVENEQADNLEGLSWGPRLPSGNPTLIVVSDDNFSTLQRTQFWAFEVIPSSAQNS